MEDPKTMEDSPKWELIYEIPSQDRLDRFRVDTGWLYRTTIQAGASTKSSGQVAVSMTLVPDRATP
jgi:hypothetical protein